ncbi:peptidylprolyl isomerase [Methylovirgula sp. 4M-Z18]|nr:peptidylprolyl isomerase [Methylovirgula sp. 4M-Z18]
MTSASRKILVGAAFAVVAFGTLSPASAKVLAKVNGVEITDEDVATAETELGSSLPSSLDGAEKDKYVLEYLIDAKIMVQKAEEQKLGDTPEFARALAYYREKILTDKLMADIAKTAVTDEAMKKVYDEAAAKMKPQEEIHARHILVATEDEAKAALKRIQAGEDFAKIADELSKDPSGNGGDLGWFTKDKMVPEFGEAAFKLDKGQVSEPVHSNFGWHIIKVEDKRMTKFPAFEDVKDQVARYVAQKAQQDAVADMRKNAKVERFDAPPAPADNTAPAPAAPAKP